MKGDSYPEFVEVVVEIPRGSRNKYEYDEKAHHIHTTIVFLTLIAASTLDYKWNAD